MKRPVFKYEWIVCNGCVDSHDVTLQVDPANVGSESARIIDHSVNTVLQKESMFRVRGFSIDAN